MFLNVGLVLSHALALLVLADVVYCQAATAQTYDPSPFNLIGTIDDMTLDVGGGPLTGGSITVNGLKITVPKNTLLTLPSITCAWSEMFTIDANNNTKPNLPLLGSVSWETTIFGNVVRGERIAGLIFIIQESVQLLQGFITEIDYTTGHFWVDTLECVLNDPIGRFGYDYHMHTPRTLCGRLMLTTRRSAPQRVFLCAFRATKNAQRFFSPVDGNGIYETSFTFPDPTVVVLGGLDPSVMVPLVVGDYITFSGTKIEDGVLAVYSLEANLGIYTAPGTKPAYIGVEAAQYAIVVADATLETDETRATAIASDPSTTIEWFAMDVDPCTGITSERPLLLVEPEGMAPIGKSVFRLGKADASPATRNVGFRYSNGIANGPKGIVAGQFIQPIFTFIFPELISYGAHEVPNQFEQIPFLAMGSGPLEFGNYLASPPPTPTIVGQLAPWPGNIAPGTTSCPPPSSTTSSAPNSSATGPNGGPPDVIEILAASTRNQKGMTMTSVTALTTSPTAKLFMALTGIDNVSPQAMTAQGGGQFSLTIATKGKPDLVTITSTGGAAPVIIGV
ncbi:hypothetical protein C8R47DRAFT_1287822 [Mycena vitilis]|nr:hypothetical protein C8R47DRAFT_1287822 [Mycena vitilis]